jgi:hypothetical protein
MRVKNRRFTILFTPGDFEVLISVSRVMHRTPSDAIRQMVSEKAVALLDDFKVRDIFSGGEALFDGLGVGNEH